MSQVEQARNGILAALPQDDRDSVCRSASLVSLPSGQTLLRPGEPYVGVFFPVSGIISAVGLLKEGQHVEIAAIGSEGMVGLGTVFAVPKSRAWFVVQVPAHAYQVPVDVFIQLFHASAALRTLTLAHAGRLMSDIVHSAICNRFHSHRERLARWLVVTMRKSGQRSFALTHDCIAQMIGGSRHLVSVEFAGLRALGAVDYQRGQIEVIDEDKLLSAACDCIRNG